MRKVHTKRILALVTSFAMILTSANLSGVNASAASGKGSVKLNKTSVSLKEKKTTKLKLVKKNIKKIKSQKWSSKNQKIATVSKSGKVTAKKKGKTTISCKVKYIAKNSKKTVTKTLKCTVTVKAAGDESAQATASTGAAVVPTTNAAVASQQPAAPTAETPVTDAPATDAPTEAPTAEPTATGPIKIPGLIEGVLEKDDITLRIPSNDASNIGEARTVSIVGGTSESMVVYDNGTMRKELTAQKLADEEMGVGVNLGNTMEATLSIAEKATATDATQFETAWGQSPATQEYIDCLHSYGLNTLRIPVAWANMDADDGSYQINEKYLGRVEEIVNYALNKGMYVIINDHWDSQWWGQFGACKKDPDGGTYTEGGNTYARQLKDADGKPVPDEEKRAEAWKRYESYWKQICERFQGYSDHLIFEGANEELGGRLIDPICSNGYVTSTDPSDYPVKGDMSKEELYDLANRINQKFVDIVRESGGNNENRFLLIPGYDTNIEETANEAYKMPTDPIEENGKNKLFVSVHYYSPNGFCLDNGGGYYREADRRALSKNFAHLQRFKDEGYAVIIGECGVCEPKTVRGSVTQWLNDTFTEARKYHAVPVLWERSQFFNREKCKLKFHDIAVFLNTVTGANGDESMTEITGKDTSGTTESPKAFDIDGKEPVWSWTGKWYKNDGSNKVGDDKFTEGGGTTVTVGGVDNFVKDSVVNATIDGDTTAITFNDWGYQAFLKLDLSQYKNPAIAFTFLDGTDNVDNVGKFSGGTSEKEGYEDGVDVDYDTFHGKAIALVGDLKPTDEKPYLALTFGAGPIVTGIYIYEMGD